MHNELARFTKEYDIDDVMNSPVVSDPLRLLDICPPTGGAALVVCSMEYAKAHGHTDPVRIAGLSTVTPVYPDTVIDLPYMATDSAGATPEPLRGFKQSIGDKVYEESGLGPMTSTLLRSTTCHPASNSTGTSSSASAPRVRRKSPARRRHRDRRPPSRQSVRRPGCIR